MGGKFYGEVGYATEEETAPGVWSEIITEYKYYGDILRNVSKIVDGENLNDNIILNNRISIVADPFAYDNFQNMRYVKWLGTLWEITAVEVGRPRLILKLGGVYNGSQQT